MRVGAVEVRAALRDAPVNAVGVTKAWAAPTVAHASTSFMVAEVEVGKKGELGKDASGVWSEVRSCRPRPRTLKETPCKSNSKYHISLRFFPGGDGTLSSPVTRPKKAVELRASWELFNFAVLRETLPAQPHTRTSGGYTRPRRGPEDRCENSARALFLLRFAHSSV